METEPKANHVNVSLRANALRSIYNECDRYDHDETGGRILGVAHQSPDGSIQIDITGVIEPGPNARRTSTSFFQDGEYQERVFRKLEEDHPQIEHLGNWHTHHVNGYPTLSAGDRATYQRTVNHEKHNLDFFYALLVVARQHRHNDLERYHVRHYILFRQNEAVYEIPSGNVVVTNEPTVWPLERKTKSEIIESPKSAPARSKVQEIPIDSNKAVAVRARDKDVIGEFFPNLRPYFSKQANTLYWKGNIRLIDDSIVQVTVPEISGAPPKGEPYYQVIVKNAPEEFSEMVEEFGNNQFVSASRAIRDLEQQLNQALYRSHKSDSSKKRWKF